MLQDLNIQGQLARTGKADAHMAYLAPSDLTAAALSGGRTAELRTLEVLRSALPNDYTVFHSVHWSREWRSVPAFGEIDFVIVNRSGSALVIEQKSGMLEETSDGLAKDYSDGRKNVAAQVHRALDGIRDKYRRQHGGTIALDYLIYCPDHRVRALNASSLDRSRIVDAQEAGELPARIMALLPPGASGPTGDRVHRFFEQTFDLVPDIHAHVTANERVLARLSGGLATTLRCLEMTPLRLRVRGTAGCGKSSVATRFFDAAVEAGRRPLLVCFNRPLAERLKATVTLGGRVDTWYGLLATFLQSRDHVIDFKRMSTDPNFWRDLQERVIGETIPESWCFDTLIVDEGQDIEPEWWEVLRLFVHDGADVLWLEDPDQTVRQRELAAFGEEGFVGFRARVNYRSPVSVARFLLRTLPFEFEIGNDLPGLGVGVTVYDDPADQSGKAAHIVSDLLKQGFRPGDIVILSLHGLAKATLSNRRRVGNFTLSRPTGTYDMLGNQVFEKGQIRFDTARRFKGQQAPAVILMDVDPDERHLAQAQRLIFSAATRATVRLEMLVPKANPAVRPFVEASRG